MRERVRCKKCGHEVEAITSGEGTFYGFHCCTCGEEVHAVLYEHFNGQEWEPF